MARDKSTIEKFRDPLYGFIEVSSLERKIIDTIPFQRLRGIHQLALTYLVYHGAEHTRFGHSLGVMHLVTRAFNSVISKKPTMFSPAKTGWYRQILRLIALTHDLGHAPFSHGSESVLPKGLEHEDFTDKIIKESKIAEYINEIGKNYVAKYGESFNITPELICNIYHGKTISSNPEFIFLRKFMDSELDCDKMDYLLRDSLYCGVSYGKYDLERLLTSLTAFKNGTQIMLAVDKGGIHAVEEFILARYFMFVQVYFHRTRRLYDKMLTNFLKSELPNGKYPDTVDEYLEWDDANVWRLMKEKACSNDWANRIVNRNLISLIYESPTHSDTKDKMIYNLISKEIQNEFGKDNIILDSADKLPHKIPAKHDIEDEKAIPVISNYSEVPTSLSSESEIISNLTKPINILRIYAKDGVYEDAKSACNQKVKYAFGVEDESEE